LVSGKYRATDPHFFEGTRVVEEAGAERPGGAAD
jgi:hypothetical protein